MASSSPWQAHIHPRATLLSLRQYEHEVDICPYMSSCDEWLSGNDQLWLSLETNHYVSVHATCLLALLAVDKHGEGQVKTYHTDGRRVVMDTHLMLRSRDQDGQKDWPWVADTWGHHQARVHEEYTMLIKSRRQLTKSSGGAGRFGHWAGGDDGVTCRDYEGGTCWH